MPRIFLFNLLLAGLVLASAGCAPRAVATPAVAQPLPLTGGEASRLGAAALTIREQVREYATTPGTYAIIPVSAETGEALEDVQPVLLGGAIAYGFSHDRSQMAFLSNRSEGCLTYCLRVMDLHTWEEMIQPIAVEKDMSAWFVVPEFDEAADILPLVMNRQSDTKSELLLVDRAQGKVTARVSVPASIYRAVTTPEGNVAVHGLQSARSGTEPVVYVGLFDGADLHLLWEKTLAEITLWVDGGGDHSDPMQGEYYDPAAAFAPDGSKLYFVAADRPLLVTVDFQERAVSSVEIRKPVSWIERLLAAGVRTVSAKTMNGASKMGVLSPDGRELYVVGMDTRIVQNQRGETEVKYTPMGLQVIDAQDGTLLGQIETEANRLALSADGQTLLLHGWQNSQTGSAAAWTEIVDIPTRKVVQRVSGTANPSHLLDGSPAWLVTDLSGGVINELKLYLPGEPRERSKITGSGYVDWVLIP